jgi:hypothetical protein
MIDKQKQQFHEIINRAVDVYLTNSGLDEREMRNILANSELLKMWFIKEFKIFANKLKDSPSTSFSNPSMFINTRFNNISDLTQTIIDRGMEITPYAQMIVEQINLSIEQKNVEIFVITSAELGFPVGCSSRDAFEAIKAIGGKKLSPEIGLNALLQSTIQAEDEIVLVYMDPIYVCNGHEPRHFALFTNSEGKSAIGGRYFSETYDSKTKWLFGR